MLQADAHRHFALSPDLIFLNHGSFGACPRVVLEAQAALREQMEADPVRFFTSDLDGLLDAARQALAELVAAPATDLAFVPNATAGVNTVLRSLRLSPGDELVVTDHEYNACRNALDFAAEQAGAKVVVAPLPFPLSDSGEVTERVLGALTPRSRLLLIDHVTSPTGLVLPIEDIVPAAQARGVDVLVDGAHGPGMVPLRLHELAPAYYTANCHKWLCAPKGAAFLYVRPDRQGDIHPLSISHGRNAPLSGRSRFLVEFDWTGTADPTPVLCLPAALRFLSSLLPGGMAALMEHNRGLALSARRLLCQALGIAPPCPDRMIGSLASLPLPALPALPALHDGDTSAPSPLYTDALHVALRDRHRIQVPVMPWPQPPRRLLRVSAQIYNRIEHYQALAAALRSEGVVA